MHRLSRQALQLSRDRRLVDVAAVGLVRLGVGRSVKARALPAGTVLFGHLLFRHPQGRRDGGKTRTRSTPTVNWNIRCKEFATEIMVTLDLKTLCGKVMPLIGVSCRTVILSAMAGILPSPRTIYPLAKRKEIERRATTATASASRR